MDTVLDYFRQNEWPSMAVVHNEMYSRIRENPDLHRLFRVLLIIAEINIGTHKTPSFKPILYDRQFGYLLCCETMMRYRNIRPDGFYTICNILRALGPIIHAPKEYIDYFIENTKV